MGASQCLLFGQGFLMLQFGTRLSPDVRFLGQDATAVGHLQLPSLVCCE